MSNPFNGPNNSDLAAAFRKAIDTFNAMTPEQQRAHRERQRRGMAESLAFRCEHGLVDWEQCSECRANARKDKTDDPPQGSRHTDQP